MQKKCQSCQILKEKLCQNYHKENIDENIKEELHSDSFDNDNDPDYDPNYLSDSDQEQETKVKSEPDLKPTDIKDLIQEKSSEKVDEVFKCVYCECEYTSKRNLWRHVKRMHPAKMEEYAIKYQIKHKGLGSIKKRKEKKENCTECPYCDKTIEKHGLWRHVQTSHAESAEEYAKKNLKQCFHCPDDECNSIFINHKGLQKHAQESHGISIPSLNPEIECPFCDEKFKNDTRSRGAVHVTTQHINERDNPLYAEFMAKYKKSWVCQECGHVLDSYQAFHSHMKEFHPHVEYKEKSSIPKSNETIKEQKERESLCIQCGKTFRTTKLLNYHVKVSHQERTFSCPECFKMFPSNSRLNKHVRTIHLNQRNYECDSCGKRFVNKNKLGQHVQAIHDKLKPYLCELCPFECAKVTNLNIHRKKSHGVQEILNKSKLIAQVKNGEHPYYDEEKFQLLLTAH